MSLTFYWIPVRHGEHAQEELNQALRTLRVLSVEKHFCPNPAEAGWAICVEHAEMPNVSTPAKPGTGKAVDYREVLDAETFRIFAALRSLRKELASKEAVPVYTIMTNEQLAALAQRRCQSLEDLKTVDGLGEARAKKYGPRFLEVLRQNRDESVSATAPAAVGVAAQSQQPF